MRFSHKPKNTGEKCPICGHIALHRHFGGVRSCKGCSAFFRRTILQFKNYKCSWNSRCFTKGYNKHGCRECRFKRCLQQGMQITAVSASTRNANKNVHTHKTGSLKQIMRGWNSCYVNRYKVMLELNENNPNCLLQSNSRVPTKFCFYNRAIQVETVVFDQYLKSCCLLGVRDIEFKTRLHTKFMTTWMAIQLLSINLTLKCFRNNRVHFLDETFIEMQIEKHLEFFCQHPHLWSIEIMAKSTMRLAENLSMTCKRFAKMRLTDVEFGVCTYYLLMKSATELKPSLAEEIKTSQLFSDLAHNYEQNFEDVAERFGNLMLVLELIGEFRRDVEEHQTLLALNQRENTGLIFC